MTDSTLIHYSGDWITNASGVLAAGAQLSVFNAGTSNLANIFTDKDLMSASANPVTADAAGLMPFAFIGTQSYKVRLETSAGALIDEQDNLPGALDTAPFSASTFAKPDTDVSSKTADYTMVDADLGTIINGNVTGGTIQITLLSAVAATNGRGITIRHIGTANQVKIVTVSSQTITRPATGVTTTGFALVGYGESVSLKSDGANWHIDAYVPPLITATTGIIAIVDRVNSAPVGPNPGDRYIVSGAFSTFEEHDVIENDGQGNYIEYTPPADSGWLAYVQDENEYYAVIDSAWVQLISRPAVQADMEAGTSLLKAVVPGVQHFHPGHPKCWAVVTVSGGTPTLATSYNITSITDTAVGELTVTIATDFSSANWACIPGVEHLLGDVGGVSAESKTAGSALLRLRLISGSTNITNQDPVSWSMAGLGDQP